MQLAIVVTHMSAVAGVAVEVILVFVAPHVVQVIAEAWLAQSAIIKKQVPAVPVA